jgi:aryl-alcohol dehydrogenase-like predicted oxidoreductase
VRYRTLGETGLIVSELCFGTLTFGGYGAWRVVGSVDAEGANAMVRTAFDAGVTFFDTANVYANGRAEAMLGEAIRTTGLPRDELVIATKAHGRVAPTTMPDASEAQLAEVARRAVARNISGQSRKHLFDAIDASLKRLRVDHIDLYQMHGWDPLTPFEEVVEALHDIVKSGRARYVGFSNLAAWQAMKAIGIAKSRKLMSFQSAQMYYSLAGRDIEREMVPLCVDQRVGLLAWSPLAGGYLSGKFTREGGPEDARRASYAFPPVDLERVHACVDLMRPMAQARGVSVAEIALAWVLHKPHITSVIIGAKTQAQLIDNLAAVKVRLRSDELAALDAASAIPVEYPGWLLDRKSEDRLNQVS